MSVYSGTRVHHPVVHRLTAAIAYTDDGNAVSLGWVAPNAIIIDGGVVVTTAFNAGTGNVADLGFRNAGDGTADDTDEFGTDLALGTAGVIAADAMATAGDAVFPEGAEIVCTPALTGTAATAGAGYAFVTFIYPEDG